MCGIAGVIVVTEARDAAERARLITRPHEAAIPEQWLDALDASIRHRGPDGQGRFRDRAIREDGAIVDVALVHRRLSILDHAGGAQPMVSLRGPAPKGAAGASPPGHAFASERSALPRPRLFQGKPNAAVEYRDLPARPEDDLVAVVFNGCIYNHRKLRADLAAAGHRFESDHSDTEVLLHGWRAWGGQMAQRLNAMMAAAIWDRARGVVSMSRDLFGEKPLYTLGDDQHRSGTRAFSACVPGLIHLKRLAPEVFTVSDDQPGLWIKPWIQFGWNQRLMPIPDIREVFAGSSECFPSAAPDAAMAFLPAANLFLNPTEESLSVDRADALVRAAVESRLQADVPVGTFLSGGLDSALVTALAAQRDRTITAYTVRMPEAGFDESAAAAATARHLRVQHQVLDCDARPAKDLCSAIAQLGLPFGDSSLLPSTWVSRAARREVTVALTGDGGDEMFLGYDRHRAMRWLAWLDHVPRQTREAIVELLPPSAGRHRSVLSRLSRLVCASLHTGYKDLLAIFPPPLDAELGLRDPRADPFSQVMHFGLTSAYDETLPLSTVALRFDRMFYLPCDLMRKSDTASMSVALEARAPMLDLPLALAAINAPISCLMPRGQRKGLLKQVARKYLPDSIINRPKQGFAIPIGEWFRSDYGGLRTLLLDRLNSREPFGPPSLGINLNMRFVRQMLDEHLGTGPSGLVRRDHSQRLYMLLVLSIWADTQAPPP